MTNESNPCGRTWRLIGGGAPLSKHPIECDCKGTGRLPTPPAPAATEETKCPECRGSGQHPQALPGAGCWNCNGEGRVPATPKADDLSTQTVPCAGCSEPLDPRKAYVIAPDMARLFHKGCANRAANTTSASSEVAPAREQGEPKTPDTTTSEPAGTIREHKPAYFSVELQRCDDGQLWFVPVVQSDRGGPSDEDFASAAEECAAERDPTDTALIEACEGLARDMFDRGHRAGRASRDAELAHLKSAVQVGEEYGESARRELAARAERIASLTAELTQSKEARDSAFERAKAMDARVRETDERAQEDAAAFRVRLGELEAALRMCLEELELIDSDGRPFGGQAAIEAARKALEESK